MGFANCDCVVEERVRVVVCDRRDCCCSHLPARPPEPASGAEEPTDR